MTEAFSNVEQRLQQELRESEQQLSAEQVSQLRMGREQALQSTGQAPSQSPRQPSNQSWTHIRLPLWLKTGGLVTAALLIAILYLPVDTSTLTSPSTLNSAGIEDKSSPQAITTSEKLIPHPEPATLQPTDGNEQTLDPELALHEDLELIEDIEFYRWIAEQQNEASTG